MTWFRAGSRPKVPDENSEGEAQLIERLKRRDRGAFLAMYDLYGGAVYRFLIHMTGSITSAEELTQEVFVQMLEGLANHKFERFDPEKGTVEGYLLGVARNLARKESKRNQRLYPLDDALASLGREQLLRRFARESKILGDIIEQSGIANLQAAILELPAHFRETIVLCCLQEKSYREAARILGCSEGTVASRLNRAKLLLATAMAASAGSKRTAPAFKGGDR